MKTYVIAGLILATSTLLYSQADDAAIGRQYGCANKAAAYNNRLPASHPHNRCALLHQQANQSWLAWLSGKSTSPQMHFFDLLELLESAFASLNSPRETS